MPTGLRRKIYQTIKAVTVENYRTEKNGLTSEECYCLNNQEISAAITFVLFKNMRARRNGLSSSDLQYIWGENLQIKN